MGKIKQAVFDAGPIIHLQEISGEKHLKQFQALLITREVAEECKQTRLDKFTVRELEPESKNFAKYLVERYALHLGESTAIALCKQERIRLLFTDDLEARETAEILGFEPHGTLAIVLRALREKLITRDEAKEDINTLYEKSTLFFTRDLFQWVIREIEGYKEK